MDVFPADVKALFHAGKFRAMQQEAARTNLRKQRNRLAWFPKLLRPSLVEQAIGLLERRMATHLRYVKRPIPSDSISGMKHNFTESLPKTLSNKTAILNDRRSKATQVAEEIGLMALLRSPSLHQFVESASGFKLSPRPGCQVIAYAPGDYVGPHNDHHPEEEHLRSGYVDVHISLSTPAVEHQWLVCERRGHLSMSFDVGVPSGVSVYHLPFWHYTTPLVARQGQESKARRWLLLASYNIDSGK